MPPLDYLALRFIRRQIPQPMMHWLLQRRLIVRPGLESREPSAAAARYVDELETHKKSVRDKTIMVFGYGGYFGVAVGLLKQGAKHVVLLDPYASLDDQRNDTLVDPYAGYVRREGNRVVPEPSSITLWHDTLKMYADEEQSKVDLLLSSSVMEHVGSPEAEAEQMARVLEPGGAQLHFVDLRDHYFRYPFEMLSYSEEIWRRFLNPGSNLNRLRAWQYEASFKKYFDDVQWAALELDRQAFLKAKPRIRPEFLTGDDQIDAVTKISITTM